MGASGRSLRAIIERWMGASVSVRITHFSHSPDRRRRFVRVEVTSDSGPVALVFFRHDDGRWYVFPPDRKLPSMMAA
ncbi:hypothetical protein DIE22_30860 [Burkholderia sp. Bp9142]|nr:hypothetical protein DIE22_30860 [Burkholderia sp. Bp9142]